MPSYCSISEAWGNNFDLNKNDNPKNTDLFKINNNTLTEPVNTHENNYMPIVSNYKIKEEYSKTDIPDKKDVDISNQTNEKCNPKRCKELLKFVLECPECQKIIYDNIRENFESKPFILSNNEILNSVFIGLFIILVLDLFVKIGRFKFSKR